VLFCCGVVGAVGCNRSDPFTLVPVSGTLKIDGEPAANILVQFMPDASRGTTGPTSSGVTDAGGHFELTAGDQGAGASAGSHVVVLFDLEEDRPEQGEQSTKPSRLSSAYATEKGGVRVAVAAGQSVVLDIPGESPLDAGTAAVSAAFAAAGRDSLPGDLAVEEDRDRQ
jgi:hypothetical protein